MNLFLLTRRFKRNRLTLHSLATKRNVNLKKEEVNASKIKKANYRFSPGSELQQTLKILKYSKVKKVPVAEPTAAK